jgi:hypothetical protein
MYGEDNIEKDLKVAWERVDCCSGQGSVVGFCECENEMLGSIIFREFHLTSCVTTNISRKTGFI